MNKKTKPDTMGAKREKETANRAFNNKNSVNLVARGGTFF
jgi:hypothetical protein